MLAQWRLYALILAQFFPVTKFSIELLLINACNLYKVITNDNPFQEKLVFKNGLHTVHDEPFGSRNVCPLRLLVELGIQCSVRR